ncbi:MAG: endolytic transglycosylase MltG, partial [Gammaproteobacteria bacterium]|nr:endolytic transglycosylase MltG [Gammaproteobacteria bacterium]
MVFLTSLGVAYYIYSQSISKPLGNRTFKLEIPRGVGVAWLANHLEKNGVVENRYIFRAYTWLNNRDIQIKAGEYTLVDVEDIPDLVEKVKSGKVIDYSITLIEGKNFKEYLTQLRSQKQLVDELDSMSH